jgi:hypothetical protein
MSRDNQLMGTADILSNQFSQGRPRFRCHHLFDWGPGTR